jgi:chromosome partitioning protein
MRNIAVVARKGGSGKTTVAVNLAIAAHRRGLRVQLADTDPQGSATEVLRVRKAPGPAVLRLSGGELFELHRAGPSYEADATIIDTPAASENAIGHAIALAHLSLLIVRPTFLDIATALQTAQILRRLRKPGLILLNQAPVARGRIEPPAVKRALEALRLMQLPVAPVVLRSRAAYQTTLASGQSVEEIGPPNANPAGDEIATLWSYIERFAFGGAVASAVA